MPKKHTEERAPDGAGMRPSIYRKIADKLNSGEMVSSSDFSITGTVMSGDKAGSCKVIIRYLYDDRWDFRFELPLQPNIDPEKHTFAFHCSPGALADNMSLSHPGFSHLLGQVAQWAGRVSEDLVAAPVEREVLRNRQRIEEIEARIEGDPEAYFDDEELQKVRDDLDKLSDRLQKEIRARIKDQNDADAKVAELEKMFESFKARSESMKRKNFFAMAVNKTWTFMSGKQLRGFLKNSGEILKLLSDNSPDGN